MQTPGWLFPHRAKLEPRHQTSSGRHYGAAIELHCLVDREERQRQGPQSEVVVSATRLICDPEKTDETAITEGSRVTLPDGNVRQVQRVKANRFEGMAESVEVFLS